MRLDLMISKREWLLLLLAGTRLVAAATAADAAAPKSQSFSPKVMVGYFIKTEATIPPTYACLGGGGNILDDLLGSSDDGGAAAAAETETAVPRLLNEFVEYGNIVLEGTREAVAAGAPTDSGPAAYLAALAQKIKRFSPVDVAQSWKHLLKAVEGSTIVTHRSNGRHGGDEKTLALNRERQPPTATASGAERNRAAEAQARAGGYSVAQQFEKSTKALEKVATAFAVAQALALKQAAGTPPPVVSDRRSAADLSPAADDGGDDMTAMLQSIMQLLMIPTVGYFVRLMIGVGYGSPPTDGGAAHGGGVESPGVEIVTAFQRTAQWSFQYEQLAREKLCLIENLVLTLMACSSTDSWDPAVCDTPPAPAFILPSGNSCSYKTPDGNNHSIGMTQEDVENPLFYPDLRTASPVQELPAVYTDYTAEEWANHYMMFYGTTQFGAYTGITFPCGGDLIHPSQMIPGWDMEYVFTYNAPGGQVKAGSPNPDKSTPLMTLLKPRTMTLNTRCRRIFLFRGTHNEFEWAVNVDFVHVPATTRPGVKMHRGYTRLVEAIWPNVQVAMAELMDSNDGCSTYEFLSGGHSLGGGMANVFALRFKDAYPMHEVTAITHASPRVFDQGAADYYKKVINGRNYVAHLDPVGHGPPTAGTDGTPVFPRCGEVAPLGGTGFLASGENPALYSYDTDAVLAGPDRLNMRERWLDIFLGAKPADFPDDVPSGYGLYVAMQLPLTLQVAAVHGCSYQCSLSTKCIPNGETKPDEAWGCTVCDGFSEAMYMQLAKIF